MLELINQLDGFDPRGNIKVLMATNRYLQLLMKYATVTVVVKMMTLAAFFLHENDTREQHSGNKQTPPLRLLSL